MPFFLFLTIFINLYFVYTWSTEYCLAHRKHKAGEPIFERCVLSVTKKIAIILKLLLISLFIQWYEMCKFVY